MSALAAFAFALALLPALVLLRNLGLVRPPPAPRPGVRPRVSLLIPARDEERTIEAALAAALASDGVDLEVLVLDDGSRDRTPERVRAVAARDPRVRLVSGVALPAGWSGKMHACARLAEQATAPWLVFQDADVTLSPDALARAVEHLEATGVDLASGVPRQETGSLGERALVPLIHLVLLGYLPVWRLRRSRHPAYAAGCGQLVVARREAYVRAGGHAAVRATLHDGVALPRAFRRAGLATDLFDATPVARCRMFSTSREALAGLSRNAREGLGANGTIVPATVLLLGGHLLPFALLALDPTPLAAAAAGLSLGARLVLARRFRQRLVDVLLHPLGVALLVALQWAALVRSLRGRGAAWRGRTYGAVTEGI